MTRLLTPIERAVLDPDLTPEELRARLIELGAGPRILAAAGLAEAEEPDRPAVRGKKGGRR